MTTAAAGFRTPPIVHEDAQALIDARLDTIERMLAGQTTRSDRLAIVREVESQIYDLLAERQADETDRDAVLAALGRLDPPEAYQTSVAEGRTADVRPRSPRPPMSSPTVAPPVHSTLAKFSAVLGFTGLVTYYLLVPRYYHEVRIRPGTHHLGLILVLAPLLATVYVQSGAAIACAAYARFGNRWALAGLSLGVITAICCAVGPLLLMIP